MEKINCKYVCAKLLQAKFSKVYCNKLVKCANAGNLRLIFDFL